MNRRQAPQDGQVAEGHVTDRISWLRAAVLGANDGLVSTASLIVGVAAAGSGKTAILIAGAAGLIGGAMSMAAGEYVSVSSQADAEKAEMARETAELTADPQAELEELAGIYKQRGLTPELALETARQLTAHDALSAHARDELGISATSLARPIQAAVTSALTFSIGAALPLMAVAATSSRSMIAIVSASTLAGLVILGASGAWLGKAPVAKGVIRVVFWGLAALAVTAGIGRMFNIEG